MPDRSFRRENLEFLVACHGSQSEYAKFLDHPTLTQPIISAILRRKRMFHDDEARDIERKLGVPETWLDRYPLRKAWSLIRKLRVLSPESQEVLHGLLKFAADNQL